MATTLEELVLRISADTRQLRSEMRRGQTEVRRSTRRMEQAFAPLQKLGRTFARGILPLAGITGTAVALGKLTQAVQQSTAALDQLDKVSERLGVSTEFLQERFFAFEQAGIDTRTSELALQRFTRRAGEAAEGTGEARGAFKALNIELRNTDGTVRNVEDVFDEAVRKLALVEDETTRLAIAFKFFDSEGARLVQVASRYDELVEAAQRAGITVDRDVIQAAVRSRDELAKLSSVLGARLTPAFTAALTKAVEFANNLISAADAMDRLTFRTGLFADTAVGALGVQLERVQLDIERVETQLRSLDSPFNDLSLGEKAVQRNRLTGERIALLEEELRLQKAIIDTREPPAPEVTAEGFDTSELNRGKEARKTRDELLADAETFLQKLVADNKKAEDELVRGAERWAGAIADTAEETKGVYSDLNDFLVGGFSQAIAQMVTTGEAGFKQLAQAFLTEFIRRSVQAFVLSPLFKFFGAAVGGGVTASSSGLFSDLTFAGGINSFSSGSGTVDAAFNNLFPTRQSGGPASVGRLYRVNDGAGVELFQPSVQGRIVPAGASGRSGGGINVTVVNNVADEVEVRSREGQDTRSLEIEVSRIVSDDFRKNGAAANTLQSIYNLQRRGKRGI